PSGDGGASSARGADARAWFARPAGATLTCATARLSLARGDPPGDGDVAGDTSRARALHLFRDPVSLQRARGRLPDHLATYLALRLEAVGRRVVYPDRQRGVLERP